MVTEGRVGAGQECSRPEAGLESWFMPLYCLCDLERAFTSLNFILKMGMSNSNYLMDCLKDYMKPCISGFLFVIV